MATWSDALPAAAGAPRRSRVRRCGSGYAVALPGLFVWEETRREALQWEKDVGAYVLPSDSRASAEARPDGRDE